MSSVAEDTVCYRHPSRETAVACSNCGRPICTQCMTPTPVGMRCPECSKQKTKTVSMRSLNAVTTTVTVAIIAINVVMYLATGNFGVASGGGGSLQNDLILFGPSIRFNHEYYRLITGGFLHATILHIGFNMYLLYVLGQLLEGPMGSARFALLYLASLLAGSFGALLLDPNVPTLGASGAVFGLMGAALFQMRARGISPMQSGIGPLILFNLAFSFIGSNISVGGHIGGLVGGSLITLALLELDKRRGVPAWAGYAVLVLACVVFAGAGIYIAGHPTGSNIG